MIKVHIKERLVKKIDQVRRIDQIIEVNKKKKHHPKKQKVLKNYQQV
jgi:hypothetical protein